MKETELYKTAIDKWGIEAQEMMLLEEMMELGKVVLKLHRKVNGSDLTQLSEEIADVRLMLDQIEWAYCQQSHVELWRERKLERLEKLLSKKVDAQITAENYL